jgi:hypothetical protein
VSFRRMPELISQREEAFVNVRRSDPSKTASPDVNHGGLAVTGGRLLSHVADVWGGMLLRMTNTFDAFHPPATLQKLDHCAFL